MKNFLLIVGIVIVFVFALYLWQKNAGDVTTSGNKTYKEMTSREVALLCTTDMATEFHIHPEIRIFINGAEVLVPHDTGIKPLCMNSIHTHKDTPVVHVESPLQKDFTLGDFFAVWEKPFDSTHLLDYIATSTGQITVTVNGTKVDTFENTALNDTDQIVIEANY